MVKIKPELIVVLLLIIALYPSFLSEKNVITIDNTKFTDFQGYGLKLESSTGVSATILVKYPSGDIKRFNLPAVVDNLDIEYFGRVDEDRIKVGISITP